MKGAYMKIFSRNFFVLICKIVGKYISHQINEISYHIVKYGMYQKHYLESSYAFILDMRYEVHHNLPLSNKNDGLNSNILNLPLILL